MNVSGSKLEGRIVPIIVVINLLIFLAWHIPFEATRSFLERNFLVSGESLARGYIWTACTSVFSHYALFHIFLNMYVLIDFGSVLESYLGSKRFLRFYLVVGFVASLSHAAVSSWWIHAPQLSALGASGAISGIVMIFGLLFPREKLLLLGFIPMPAIGAVLLLTSIDLTGLVAQSRGHGLPIGHGAHLGGALAGALYYWFVYGKG